MLERRFRSYRIPGILGSQRRNDAMGLERIFIACAIAGGALTVALMIALDRGHLAPPREDKFFRSRSAHHFLS
jgi:hypothetical protein